ncbi:PAS domain S-box protein [Altererythrobacter xixiisoli]|uniref:histidine kinase n=1 Tax=Croceibacterium xixiisoli TaxID=1476466 RepID=A0A6I4TRG5_9SPHN|nr:PAS domain S-box protein [Croceibacterium xixiisoli]MXO98735.1 PAS domain S-box protein [Croceibacterium xixiisoli]
MGARGEMARRIAEFDWSATSLGPMDAWPQSLRTIIAFMTNCPVPLVMLWGPDGYMVYNDAYAIFAGDAHPRLLGSKVREGWPEVADFNDHVMRTGLAGKTLAYRNHVLSLNRTGVFEDVWLNLDYSPVFDDAGQPAGVIAVVVEITEAVMAERALRESERRLRFLDDLGRTASTIVDADDILAITTRMTGEEMGVSICAYADMDEDQNGFTIRGDWAAPGAQSIVGHYDLTDFGELAVSRLSAGQPLVVKDIERELTAGAAATFVAIGVRATICMPLVKDGRLTALMAVHHAQPHDWTDQELALIRAVTDRSWAHVERVGVEAELRRAAEELRELNETLESRVNERSDALLRSQMQFRLLVQGVTDYAIYMLDPEGHVSSWNAGAERIKGYAPEEIIGRHFSTFYRPADRDNGDPARALEAARKDGSFTAEGWRIRKDGSEFRASVVIDTILDEQGDLIGFTKITRDVTEREAAQRELETAREALFQSQKLEAIGQLTGGVAHDFNNLLMAISSSLALLRKRMPDDDAQAVRLIENSMAAADRGAALTQRMLAFARRQELKPERVDVAWLVRGMIELMQRSLGPSWEISTRFPPDLAAVFADPNQLEMALLNLAVNARDAMPGGGDLRIEASPRKITRGEVKDLPAGAYIRLSVIDNGSGMDAETLARATEPFFTTKGVGKGTGLGLSMIDGFARQMGGVLQLESVVGTGTSAHLWLPLAQESAAAPDRAPTAVPQPARGNRPLTVLAVDDDAIILMNTAAIIEDMGHRVFEASSGAEALEIFTSHPDIDLVVTDHAMPGMKGTELIAALVEQRPDVPIILATGYGEIFDNLPPRALRLGKPFSQDELETAVRKVCATSV